LVKTKYTACPHSTHHISLPCSVVTYMLQWNGILWDFYCTLYLLYSKVGSGSCMIPNFRDTDPNFLNIIKFFLDPTTQRHESVPVHRRTSTYSIFFFEIRPSDRKKCAGTEFQCPKMTLCLACIKGTVSQSDESKLTPRLSFRRFT
jgi:hypothetical protein